MKAWAEVQDETAIQRAVRTSAKTSDEKVFADGDVVYVWRQTTDYTGWVGPGVVISQTANGRSLWVSLRGYLIKASREQVRMATNEEHLGAELIKVISKEMLEKLEQGETKHFRDIQREGGPPLESPIPDSEMVVPPPENPSPLLTIDEEGELNEAVSDAPVEAVTPPTLESRRSSTVAPPTLESPRPSTVAPPTLESRRPSTVAPPTLESPRPSTVAPPTLESRRPSTVAPPTLESRRPSTVASPTLESRRPSTVAPPGPSDMISREVTEGLEPDSMQVEPEVSDIDHSLRRSVRVDELPDGRIQFGPLSSSSTTARPMPYPFSQAPTSWPSPTRSSSHFFETGDFTQEDDGAKWWKDKISGRTKPSARSKRTFHIKEAMAVFSFRDRWFFMTKKSPGQVTFKKLVGQERKHFEKARDKEIRSLLESGAISILSTEESKKFRRDHPEYVLESRFVDRWKPTEAFTALAEDFDPSNYKEGEDCGAAPKFRWCVVGWQDPMLHSIERSAPTPTSLAVNLSLQAIASRKWDAYVKDAKAAFTQALPTTRSQKLACSMPSDMPLAGCSEDQLILLHTEVYGLVSGPSWWRRSLLDVLLKLGYQLNPYDRCVLTLPENPKECPKELQKMAQKQEGASSTSPTTSTSCSSSATTTSLKRTRGVIVIQVDDLLEAGDEEHRRRMSILERIFRFGKIVRLKDVREGTGYSGRRLLQYEDGSIGHSMNDYIVNRMKPVVMRRRVLVKNAPSTPLQETEITQYRAALACLNWVSREGRPDVAAAASSLASKFPIPRVKDLLDLNQVIAQLKNYQVTLVIPAVKEEDIRHFVISDSAHDPSGKSAPQHGWIQGTTDPTLNAGQRAVMGLVAWRSRKLRRKAGNTLLCESIALSTALGNLERQVAMWKSLVASDFSPKDMIKDDYDEQEARGQATVIADDCMAYKDPDSVAVIDAKSLYDSIHSEQAQGDDSRSVLELAVIRESLQTVRGRARWVPHNRNPADSLTKFEGAHMEPMLSLLATNRYQIQEEQEILDAGKQSQCRLKSKA